MHKFIKIILILFFFVCCLSSVSLADAQINSTITFINLNDKKYYDIEIVQRDDKILLPIKQIADILQVKYEINHSKKEIIFETYKVNKDFVYKSGQKLSSTKNVFLQTGMIDGVKDEIFTSIDMANLILDEKIIVDNDDLSLRINTKKKLECLKEEDIPEDENAPILEKIRAYNNISTPTKSKKITLDSVALNNNTSSNSANVIYQNISSSTTNFTNSNSIRLNGKMLGGEYDANLSTNSYKDELLSFSGMNFKYKNNKNGLHYEVGKVSGLNSDGISLGTDVLGAQVYDYDPKEKKINDIDGYVENDSIVNIYVDDVFHSSLSTYKGYYSLADLRNLDSDVKKLTLKEKKKDGTEKVILVKVFQKYENEGFDMEKDNIRKSFFAGVSGFNNRLFAQDGFLYETTSKKLTIGSEYKKAIKENLTMSNRVLSDKIITYDDHTIWAQNYYNSHSILSMGTFRNTNLLEGSTAINSFNYRVNDNLRLCSEVAGAYSHDITDPSSGDYGYSFALKSFYNKNNLDLDLEAYNISPNFYYSGAQYGFISDRLGGRIKLNYKYKDWSVSTQYNKYISNLEEKYDTSITNFDEFRFSIFGNIKKLARFRYNFNTRKGTNNMGENLNYSQDFNLSKYFKNGVSLESGYQNTFYSSKFSNLSENTNFESSYFNIYLRGDYNLPKNKGRINLAHEITSTLSDSSENNYNIFRLNYTFPEFKRLTLNLGAGYKYLGNNKGFSYNATLGYRMKSGSVITLGYRYDLDNSYLIDNMYIPTSARHSINMCLNDTFALVPSGLKPVGNASDTKGFIEVAAYLDVNNNNKFDDEDVEVEDVPIRFNSLSDVIYTHNDGKTSTVSMDKGVYRVKVDDNLLQSNLSIKDSNSQGKLVLVEAKKCTKLAFKMTSSVGSIKGKLKIVDDFGRNYPIKDFIVVLHDANDKEVQYSTVNNVGEYYFSGISPGKYRIMLDKSFVNDYNLISYEDKGEKQIEIPFVYKEFVDLNEQNLVYKTY